MESDFISSAKIESIQKKEETEKRTKQKQFLQFYLAPDTKIMLPIDRLNEVMTIQLGQIIPIPHMNPNVMGVYNWRGEILWMVDLGKIFWLLPWYEQKGNKANYKAIVINIEKKEKQSITKVVKVRLGLVVSRVEDIKWCEDKSIHKIIKTSTSKSLDPFLQGYWVKSDRERIPILNGEKLLSYLPASSLDIN